MVLIGCMQMLYSHVPLVVLYHFEDRSTFAQYFACLLHCCSASNLLKNKTSYIIPFFLIGEPEVQGALKPTPSSDKVL